MSASFMAAGDSLGYGSVRAYRYVEDVWISVGVLQGSQLGSGFGSSVDLSVTGSLLVGAPELLANGTSIATGGASFYRFTDGHYDQLGATIRGDHPGELFGSAVSMTNNGVLAIGAPNSPAGGSLSGAVYSFFYDIPNVRWTQRAAAIVGSEGDLLGSAVDISADGNLLIVGGPGSNGGSGLVAIYGWNAFEWTLVDTKSSNAENDAFGSSAKFLTNDGLFVAVGAPGFRNGSGRIRIYQRQDTGGYSLLANTIQGSSGERLGSANAVGATTIDGQPAILASTATGSVKTYQFSFSDSSWQERFPAMSASTDSSVQSAVSGSMSAGYFAAGAENEVVIFKI
jgi:hypothetical protein